MNLKITFGLALLVLTTAAQAQRDTTQKKTIEITSSFRPTLMPSAKINFSPSASVGDTTRPRLTYAVPVQNLSFSVPPSNLKPAALVPDSSSPYANNGVLKAGFGNYSTPYVQAGISFGDGRKASGAITADYISSKGKRLYQEYNKFGIRGDGLFAAGTDHKLKLGAGISHFATHRYGFLPDTLKTFTKDALLQRFNSYNISAELSRNSPTDFNLTYAPSVNLWLFSDNRDGKETHFNFKVPVQVGITDNFKFGVDFQGDVIKYSAPKNVSVSSNVVSITPAITYTSEVLKIKAGLMPSWNNGDFKLLPDIQAEARIPEQPFMGIAGLRGYFDINSYRNLAMFNPFIAQPTTLFNTRNTEFYGGFKGNLGTHFSYLATAGFVNRSNVALYLNDTSATGNTYRVGNEARINSIKLHGELSYQNADKFYWNNSLNVQTFGSFKTFDKAYGLIPLEIQSHLRAKLFTNFYFTADLYYFEGNWYKSRRGQDKTGTAVDLNAGVDFKVYKNVSLWLQFNNVLNQEYQRWNQYQVLGFQALGGAKVTF